jgi:[ribosomal protein S18]-alanine N-acetyltransferase
MYRDSAGLEIRRLTTDWKESLLVFFRALEEVGNSDFFQPHPFTDEGVEQILRNTRRDLYYVLIEGTEVLGYGMLRGWDEGYETPSLGIAIHPRARGKGLGRAFMHFLGAAAICRGAQRVRLRVKPQNARAAKLYESLGYEFRSEEDGGYLVGVLDFLSNWPDISARENIRKNLPE